MWDRFGIDGKWERGEKGKPSDGVGLKGASAALAYE